MKHDAIEDELLIRLLMLADSMDEDRYPDADLIRSAAHRIEVLTASERLIASERNAYKERAEQAFRPEDLDLAAMRQYATEAIAAAMRHRHTQWGRFGVRGERCACCGQKWPCDVQVLLQVLDELRKCQTCDGRGGTFDMGCAHGRGQAAGEIFGSEY